MLYRVKLFDSDIFKSLSSAVLNFGSSIDLIVYDNSPVAFNPGGHPDLNISYIHNGKNPGISTAYNVAAKMSQGMNKDWLLIFDQDTVLPPDSLYKYADAIWRNPAIKLFAPILINQNGSVISPAKFRFRMGTSPGQLRPGVYDLGHLSPVNSGICVQLNLFHVIGGYNERIPLDYSDYDFVERLRSQISSFVVLDLYLEHNLSASENTSFSSAEIRFRYLCMGLKHSSKSKSDLLFSHLVAVKRALRLTYVYRSFAFFKTLYDEFS